MDIRLERLGSTLVVKLDGELDQSCANEIRERIDREISIHGINNLVMDFNRYFDAIIEYENNKINTLNKDAKDMTEEELVRLIDIFYENEQKFRISVIASKLTTDKLGHFWNML